jgi:hypothetical protein
VVLCTLRVCATQATSVRFTEKRHGDRGFHHGSLLLAAATVVVHYELLQFASTLSRRLTVPARPRIIIVIGAVLAAQASLYAAAYYVLQTQGRHRPLWARGQGRGGPTAS